MNDIQKFVNGVLKNHSMHKRYIAVLTALSMVVSIVVTSILVMPADSKAGSLICEKTEHIHNESCKKLVCGLDEVIYDEVTTEAVAQTMGQLAQLEGEAVGAVEMVETENASEVAESYDVVENTESIAEVTEETVVSESAQEIIEEISEDTNEDTVSEVTESVQHIHTDECYMYVCGFEEHTHSEGCYESVEVDPTPDEVDSYMINQNAFDVFNVFGRPMHLLYNDVSATGEFSTENNSDSTMPVNPGAILGVATHFHVLAEEASFESHVHGNVATNYLVKCGAFGVYLNKLAGKSSVNYIRNFAEYAPLDNAYQTKLVLGAGYSYQLEANRYKITAHDGRVCYIPVSNFPEGDEYEPHIVIDDSYINVTKELDKFADMSRAIAAKPSKGTIYSYNDTGEDKADKVYITDEGTESYILDFSNITDKYIYYTLDMTGNDKNGQPLINFSTCSKVLEIKGITEDKFLFLTVDVGSNTDVAFNKSWKVYRADDQEVVYGTGEVPLDDGSCRVIYNIVNSTTSNGVKAYTPFGEEDGMPTDAKIILGEQKNGTFLVPRGYVNCAGNTNGTIIAYKYVATGESHRADIQFEGEEVDDVDCPTISDNFTESGDNNTQQQNISITVNKVWNDGNENHQNDNVEIQLYKAYESNLDINDTSLIGTSLTESKIVLVDKNSNNNQITLNPSNNWTAKFENLPVKDVINDQTDGQIEKRIYYYIKEVNKEGYTATYSANGLNSVDRTVTVRNSKKMSITIEKKWYDSLNVEMTKDIPEIEINFNLYKSTVKVDNNIPTADSRTLIGNYTLNSSNNRMQTISNLESEENGQPLYYYVEEVNPSSEYNVTYENNAYNVNSSGNMIIKNTQKASGTISITVTKNWNASDYSGVVDYVSPVRQYNIPVKVTLQKSTDSTNWINVGSAEFTTSYTFSDLPKKDKENDKDLYYRVVEGFVYGYKAEYNYSYNNGNGYIIASSVGDKQTATVGITNNLITQNLNVNKIWHNNMSEGVNSIVIEVYRKLAGYEADIAGDEVEDVSGAEPDDDTEQNDEVETDGDDNDVIEDNIVNDVLSLSSDKLEKVSFWSLSGWAYKIPESYCSRKINYITATYAESFNSYADVIMITNAVNDSSTDYTQSVTPDNNRKTEEAGASERIHKYDFTNYTQNNTNYNGFQLYSGNTYYVVILRHNVKFEIEKLEITFADATAVSNTQNSVLSFIRNNFMLFANVNYNSNELTISSINDSLSSTTFSYDELTGTYPAYKVTISESDGNTSKYYGNTLTSLKMSCQIDNNLSCEAAVLLLKNNTVVEWIHSTVSSSSGNIFTFKNGGCYIETGNTYDIYVFKYTETTSSNFRINDATCNFSIGNTTTDGKDEYTTGNTTHNFTANGTLSSFYTISGSLSTGKGTHYYNGLTLTQCLKINSDASISFSVSENNTGKLILVFGESNGKKFCIDNTSYTVDDDGIVEIDNLSPGSHTISESSSDETNLFYMTYSETVVESQKKDEVSFANNVLTVIPANAKGEENKYKQDNGHYFKNAWGYQIPSEHRGKMITNIKVTFGSDVNGAEICILPNRYQGVTQAYWEGSIYNVAKTDNSSLFEWSNISYTIPTTYPNYSLYVIEVGDINSNGKNSDNLQAYTITELKITFANQEEPEDTYVEGNKTHNFKLNGTLSSFYEIEGTLHNGDVWSNDTNYKKYLAVSKISFTTRKKGKIFLVGDYTNRKIKVNGVEYDVNNDGLTVELEPGNHTITKSNDDVCLYYMSYSDNQSGSTQNNVLVLPVDKFIVEGQTDHYQNQYAWTYFLKEYKGKTIKSIKANFGEITSGNQYNGLIILHDGSNNVLQNSYTSQQGEITVDCGNGYVVNDSENYKLVVTRNISNEYELTSVEITFAESISNQEPTEPDEPKIEHLERDITINKSLYGDTLHENRGYWNDDNHEGFGFYNDEHKNAYADKYFHSVQIYYRDMLLGFPDYQKDTKVYLLRSSEINGSWCPDQTGYGFDDNIATWYYGSESGEIASNLGNEFFKIKTSRPDEISKVVICFTDGSTYTMNNTAYVASSKVESSEDDYTYNTGEYVLIAKITLTADTNWSYTLGDLPATDGQGNAYTYHIKETNIYGSEADKYKILSYTHEDGIVLENDSNNIGVTNARNDDESIIVLPNTGGTGAKGYFIAGIIVMICSAAGYTVIKRRLIR